MARARKNPDQAGVVVILPADMIAELDRLAGQEFCSRAEAIRLVLQREFAAIRGSILGAAIHG